ncbi:MAG: phosphoglucosamine mutase [Methanoregulaceae archaeon]|jgi:phosphomannomutase/phosphoglucomutase|nr:phosphoglucosamine mutase [Methanoregulaceae archaeon]MCU0628330.1 phosphoglucosamine mutase [Methanoregulaceae archaeon]
MRGKRLFGTNGVRGVAGVDMTPSLALSIGLALGSMRKGSIAIGRDTRTSGPALGCALKAGLLATGCDVTDCGILPTPALQYLVRQHFDAGAVITASHNPPEYNGVKVIEPDGTEMGDEETIRLELRILDEKVPLVPWNAAGREYQACHLVHEYIDAVVQKFLPGIGEGITVAVDPGCGAACATTPEILTRLGCRVFTINSQMDGNFPGRPPEPSTEGLLPLGDLVRATGASLGIAHDGDADRAVFLDEQGRFIEENKEFALIASQVCGIQKGTIVMPVSTSRVVETIARNCGCDVKYTPVGSIYVARAMRALEAEGTLVAFGGEGNGGLIYPDHQYCRDGGMTAAMMIAILAKERCPISELVAAMPEFHLIKEKIRGKDPAAMIERLNSEFSRESIDRTDGIRINRADSWALVRPSGTEPLVRVIVESPQKETADLFFDEIMQKLGK